MARTTGQRALFRRNKPKSSPAPFQPTKRRPAASTGSEAAPGLTLRSGDPRAVRLLPQQARRLTCSASELKRDCQENDKNKGSQCYQASCQQAGTIASDQFGHFSPPQLHEKRMKGARGSGRGCFSTTNNRPRHFLIRVERARRGPTDSMALLSVFGTTRAAAKAFRA